ncbi:MULTISPECIES: aminoacyl-tRNA hydrolase [Clostridium]|uniref:aminoacyl-tRNA hydrolase n=1 Tax=Clostridium TaxID=1485 RepID=UPI000824ED74|nr:MULTISPECIES: aminoacyl-tRNA hydrolase [Clostridium]PJI08782.1 aminoacyl-tRNA hydrolase [Clostridium sp. CT7]
MFLIVGLGNPGQKYEHTRHNTGFDAIEKIADRYDIKIDKKKFKGLYGSGIINGEKVILLKPYTYMNLSGESVQEAANFYKMKNENIIVIYDDISLDVGKIRMRGKGSAGGHNGIKNIILNLSSDEFPRIKIGVGNPIGNLVDYVLGRFKDNDRVIIEKVFDVVTEAVSSIVADGLESAMNKFNGMKLE